MKFQKTCLCVRGLFLFLHCTVQIVHRIWIYSENDCRILSNYNYDGPSSPEYATFVDLIYLLTMWDCSKRVERRESKMLKVPLLKGLSGENTSSRNAGGWLLMCSPERSEYVCLLACFLCKGEIKQYLRRDKKVLRWDSYHHFRIRVRRSGLCHYPWSTGCSYSVISGTWTNMCRLVHCSMIATWFAKHVEGSAQEFSGHSFVILTQKLTKIRINCRHGSCYCGW